MPALLQKEIEHKVAHLHCTFRVYLARQNIYKGWRQVKVMFIPKPMKTHHTEAKAYFPITLSSLMLKTIAKLVDRHIRDEILRL